MATSKTTYQFRRDPFQPQPLTPGPLGHNDAASPAAKNTFVGDTPGPLGMNDHADPKPEIRPQARANISITTTGRWDPEAAAAFLKNPVNGWTGSKSKGRCARAVRKAINAGQVATPNNPVSAAEYKNYLPKLGFVSVSSESYAPKLGDIAVFPAVPGHIHGHIQMYTGEVWQSDYVQGKKNSDRGHAAGFYANRIWISAPFTIFRKQGGR